MKRGKRLKKMPIEYLWDGLVLKDDIYNHNGKVLLIPKGETITEKKLEKLAYFSTEDNNIMVCEETYYEVMSSSNVPVEVRRKILEDNAGYTDLKDNTAGIFQKAGASDRIVRNNEIDMLIHEISEKLSDVDPVVILSCINFPRPMDEGLQRHSLNVAFLNGMLGEWMHLSKEDIRLLVMAGLLHDVGKTKIPEEILNAPRKLTQEEFKIVQTHPLYSYEMLGAGFDERVKLAARQHHEKLTGNGYPDKIAEEQISVFARITAVSDIYDAMVSKRSYKEGKLPFDVFDMFYNEQYEGLDMDLVMTFLRNMRNNLINKKVIMSDGSIGVIKYVPPNDSGHPIVQHDHLIKQTNEVWFCKELLSTY